jgi:hypothetical protein
MWKFELCKKIFDDETIAVEVRFGYVDSGEVAINRPIHGFQYRKRMGSIM